MIRIDIATLFPEMCRAVLSESIIGRAMKAGYIDIRCHNIRDYAGNKHNRVDDKPYGGGTGMVMQAQPIYDCINAIRAEVGEDVGIIYMSPQGKPLTQQKVKELARLDRLIILCGHYEGIDCRVTEELGAQEISVGDFVVTGGELPALMLTDAIARMQEGVLPNTDAYSRESHYEGLLEYPQYTRPEVWKGRAVPQVLLSGDHAQVEKWQEQMSWQTTLEKRPDLLTARKKDGSPYAKYLDFSVNAEGFPDEADLAVLRLARQKLLTSAEKKMFVKINKYLAEKLPDKRDNIHILIKSEARDMTDMYLSLCDILKAHKVNFNIIFTDFAGKIIREYDDFLVTEPEK